jgi:hypothetical protein
MFLEAIHLEEELKKKAPQQTKKSDAPKDKMSNKERNRYQEVQKEIEKLEGIIQALTDEMSNASAMKLSEIQDKVSSNELKLEKLMEEWALLEEKLS